jgi:hypothetical protein
MCSIKKNTKKITRNKECALFYINLNFYQNLLKILQMTPILGMILVTSVAQANVYNTNIDKGVQFLSSQQNGQGAIGFNADLEYLHTSEALWAMRMAKQNSHPMYSKALAWLQNQSVSNNDFLARKLLAMHQSGLNIQPEIDQLLKNQQREAPSQAKHYNRGWGMGNQERSSNLDTALALIALETAGVQNSVLESGLSQLLNTNLNISSTEVLWGINYDSAEEMSSSLYALIALSKYKHRYNLSDVINKGVTAVIKRINVNTSNQLKALAVLALEAILKQFDVKIKKVRR